MTVIGWRSGWLRRDGGGKAKTDDRFLNKEPLFLVQRVPAVCTSSAEEEGWQLPGVWTGSAPLQGVRQFQAWKAAGLLQVIWVMCSGKILEHR